MLAVGGEELVKLEIGRVHFDQQLFPLGVLAAMDLQPVHALAHRDAGDAAHLDGAPAVEGGDVQLGRGGAGIDAGVVGSPVDERRHLGGRGIAGARAAGGLHVQGGLVAIAEEELGVQRADAQLNERTPLARHQRHARGVDAEGVVTAHAYHLPDAGAGVEHKGVGAQGADERVHLGVEDGRCPAAARSVVPRCGCSGQAFPLVWTLGSTADVFFQTLDGPSRCRWGDGPALTVPRWAQVTRLRGRKKYFKGAKNGGKHPHFVN